VNELLARELRERVEQHGVTRVAEDQVERSARGLLLAVRVVDQDLFESGERALRPRGIGCGASAKSRARAECRMRRQASRSEAKPSGGHQGGIPQARRSGLVVSEVSVGSWLTLGSSVDRAGTREIVHRAFDLGVNLFDTADVYSNGAGEEALGDALAGIPRRYVVIATKCFFPMSERPNDRGLSRKHIFESIEGSLRRLGTDYVDLLQCHRYDPNTPVEETVRAFDDLVRQGKVLYWGVSEWSAEQIVDACRCADALHAVRPISNQPQYNALRRGIEAEVIPVSRREGLSQIAFSPLAQGALTGKYSGGRRPATRAPPTAFATCS
jgi:aryl-alcohol dehydrogenase-like predicted oxidoreductase